MSTAGFLILAGGHSRRFGSNKLLAPLPSGQTLLETTLQQLPKHSPVFVVCQPGQASLINRLESIGVDYSSPEESRLGMGHSLSAGIKATQHWHGWVICLADMPWIKTATYRQIIAALSPDKIVVPQVVFEGNLRSGNPVGFGKSYSNELKRLQGDQGGKRVVQQYKHQVTPLCVKDPGILLDIDYPDDINKGSQSDPV